MSKIEEMAAAVHATQPPGYPSLESARAILVGVGYSQADFDETQMHPPTPSENGPVERVAVDAVLARVVQRVRAMRGPFNPL